MPDVNRQILSLFEQQKRFILQQPLYLGGTSGAEGGTDGRAGGFIGQLPQSRVTYDFTEASTLATAGSPTLVDNLNHIRQRLVVLESGGGSGGSVAVYSNGSVVVTSADVLDFDTQFTVVENPAGEANISLGAYNTAKHAPTGIEASDDNYLAYDYVSRTIQLIPTGSECSYWITGDKYSVVSGDINETHPDVSGFYYLYIRASDNSVQFSTTPFSIIDDVPLAGVYYDSTTPIGVAFDERHVAARNPYAHYEFHNLFGAYWHASDGGLVLEDYTLQPTSPANSDNQWSLTASTFHDEDIEHEIPAHASGSYLVAWRDGADGIWQWDISSVPLESSGTYIYYNENTGATWQRTALGNNQYVNYFVCHLGSVPEDYRTVVIMGQELHLNLADAQAESLADITWGAFPSDEVISSYKITFRTNSSYTTTGKARIEYVTDTRLTNNFQITSGAAILQNHNALSGLQGGQAGEYYHITLAQWTELTSDGYVVVTGDQMTGDLTFASGAGVALTDYIGFNTLFSDGHVEGRLHWNIEDGTLELDMPGGNVHLQIGQEHLIRAKNSSGTNILNGNVVYISGGSGANALITLANADTLATAIAIGVATEDIDDGRHGYVTTQGLVRGLDTSSYSPGTILWLDTTDGLFTDTRPAQPNFGVVVGQVVRQDGSEGVVYVNIDIVPRLISLSDVDDAASPAEGNILNWNNSDGVWDVTNKKTSQLHIEGSSDEVQLLVEGNSSQTAKIASVQNSSGNELFFVDYDGRSRVRRDVAGQTFVFEIANLETAADLQGAGVQFILANDAATPENIAYGKLLVISQDVSDGTEDAIMLFRLMVNGNADIETIRMNNFETVINEGGVDRNLRVEGDTNANLLFVDAGLDRVAIGHGSPDTILDINGAFTFRELSADPADPDEGSAVLWMSNGTDSGDDGDILIKVTAGGTTKLITVIDFSEA